jgi:hypothetical protein
MERKYQHLNCLSFGIISRSEQFVDKALRFYGRLIYYFVLGSRLDTGLRVFRPFTSARGRTVPQVWSSDVIFNKARMAEQSDIFSSTSEAIKAKEALDKTKLNGMTLTNLFYKANSSCSCPRLAK